MTTEQEYNRLRARHYRERKRAEGLHLTSFWLTAEEKTKVRKYLAELRNGKPSQSIRQGSRSTLAQANKTN
jgi:hypothetical protein